MNLPVELRQVQEQIRDLAADYGLDFYETFFEMLDYRELNEVAAFSGFPTRYPHWRHGMQFEQIDKGYRYGLQKIYELVINNDPCYAYLLSSNNFVDQKLVIAHVYAHCDFFKNNVWFSRSSRKMMDQMANHATRIRRIIDRQGLDSVESFLDAALSLENLVDLHGQFVEPRDTGPRSTLDDLEEPETLEVGKLRSKDYMDPFINPPDFVARQRRRQEEAALKPRFPAAPERDVLGFLLAHAPLERWEWEVLHLIREEALYFAPQRATKIMNEGWATYWHRKIMTEAVLTDEDVVDYADTMSGTLASGSSVNPYKIGLELYLDIEERWDRGRHGLDYDRCDEARERREWDTEAMAGNAQIFLARRIHSDVTFIDEYLTEEFCHRQKLFVYQWNPRTKRKEIATRDFDAVKEQLLRQLANGGSPVIDVVDANRSNRGELLLLHRWDGQDLRDDYAQATLRNLRRMWKRPVLLETCREGKRILYRNDGAETEVEELEEGATA